jgi:outer membrane protein OmpA-like peptidoglycan-associated protein
VNTRSPEIALALAVVGLLSYAACTAEKNEVRNQEVQSIKQSPKIVEGIFASDDHLVPIYFDLNQSKLSSSGEETVKANAEWLKNQPPYLVRIIGYADSRGSLAKNERLAERRAAQLREAYVSAGIAKERISIATRGAEAPACEPVNEDCLAKSRRCETLIEDKSLASR